MLRMVSRITVGDQVIRADEVARVDIAFGHELVDVDRSGGFQSNILKFVLRHLNVGVGINLVSLGNVFVGNFLASVGIHLGIFDAVARLTVDLVEADFFGIGSGRIQSDRTGNEGKAQKAFPVGAGGHGNTPNATELGFKTILPHWFRHSMGCLSAGPPKPSACQFVLFMCLS